MSYEIEGFLDKNKDKLQEELLELLANSQDPLISSMFQDQVPEKESKSPAPAKTSASTLSRGSSSATMSKGTIKKLGLTVITAFKVSLLCFFFSSCFDLFLFSSRNLYFLWFRL